MFVCRVFKHTNWYKIKGSSDAIDKLVDYSWVIFGIAGMAHSYKCVFLISSVYT